MSLKLYYREKGDRGDSRFVWKGAYLKFTSDISPNWKDIRTRVRVCYVRRNQYFKRIIND